MKKPGVSRAFVADRVAPVILILSAEFLERRVARLKTVSVCSSQKTRVDNTI
jgi:hypothetical protein